MKYLREYIKKHPKEILKQRPMDAYSDYKKICQKENPHSYSVRDDKTFKDEVQRILGYELYIQKKANCYDCFFVEKGQGNKKDVF